MELASIITLLEHYQYLIIFPLACFEGPMVSFVAGSLLPLGYFSAIPLYVVLVLADVIPDAIYYAIGRFGRNKNLVERVGHKVGITPERFSTLDTLWHTHTVKTMAVTKFAYGLSTPLLITAGLVHVPFWRFVSLSTALAFVQYGVLLTLGYFFGSYFMQVQSVYTRVQYIAAAAIVVFVLYYLFAKSIRTWLWDKKSN